MNEPVWDGAGRMVLPGRTMRHVVFGVLAIFLGLLVLAELEIMKAQWPIGAAALALVFFSIQLVPGANRLELTREGFTCILFFCRYPTSWRDVSKIAQDDQGNVVWNYAPHVVHESRKLRSIRIAQQNTGYDACLPDTYGLSAGMLAALMNRIREESIQ